MSYRYEDKILVSPSELKILKYHLMTLNLKYLYEPRAIHSIYLDNKNFDSFYLSEEGVVPRKKIRIRSYPKTENKKLFFEQKQTSNDGRFKQSEEIDSKKAEKLLKIGYQDKDLGFVKPVIEIRYLREYYSYKGLRITFDQSIKYLSHKKQFIFAPELMNVVEIKYKTISDLETIPYLDNLPRERFSKYCRGIINNRIHINEF